MNILPKSGVCPLCCASYKRLKTHFNSCSKKATNIDALKKLDYLHTDNADAINSSLMNIDDDLFDDNLYEQIDIDIDMCRNKKNYKNYLTELREFNKSKDFCILHININSIFTKFSEIYEILSLQLYDVLLINESKLDEHIPDSFCSHVNYHMIRRDRNRNGGGLLIYLNKKYNIIESYNSIEYESIFLQIGCGANMFNIFSCYKPPKESDVDFIEFLESFILKYNITHPTFIIGDLNMNLLTAKGDLLRKLIQENAFVNHVNEITRIGHYKNKQTGNIRTTPTCIDLVLHNSSMLKACKVVECPISDHKFVLCKLNVAINNTDSDYGYWSRNLNTENLDLINFQLLNSDFSKIINSSNVEEQWSNLKSTVLSIVDSIAPLKYKKTKAQSIDKKFPWIDKELNVVKGLRDRYYSIANKSKCQTDWLNYKKYRNLYKSMYRTKLIEFFALKTASDFRDTKKFWNFYKSSIVIKSDKSSSSGPSYLVNDGVKITDTKELANSFNSFFTNISCLSSTVNKVESADFIFNNLKQLKVNSLLDKSKFSFSSVNKNDIMKHLKTISSNSSPGVSGISIQIFKHCSDVLLPIINLIFNNCIQTCQLPAEWKCAVVTPLYKNKGDKGDINNYRGISVLPPIAKLFEKVLAEQINIYFVQNKLFYNCQHGFRANFSCETALHEVISKINNNTDKKLISLLLFVDFRKAFDLVDIDLLLLKLFHYGFNNDALKLMRDYFSNRQQLIKLRDSLSDISEIVLGVPQGSVLGPLLFIIFINDLPFYLDSLSILFADDTTIISDGNDLDTVMSRFKNSIQNLLDWCNFNRMDINFKKTYCMFITNKRIELPTSIDIGNNIMIEVVTKFKLLGIQIDNKLSFEQHVSDTCLKINRKLFSIKRIFYLSTSVKLQFFKTFLLPHFDYCISLSIYFSKRAIQKLSNCYYMCLNKLFKFNLTNMTVNTINDYLKQYNLFSLQHRIVLRISTFVHKILHNKQPENLYNSLKFNDYKMSLRSNGNIYQPRVASKYGDLTFEMFCCKYINNILINIINLKFPLFKYSVCININLILDKFIYYFKHFDVNVKQYF